MKDVTLAELISALPECSALAGIRAYIFHQGLEGDLEEAAKVFEQVWRCPGHEEIKAELMTFLVSRYAYRSNLVRARELYGRFASLGTAGTILQARAAALHILACMLMDVKLDDAISLWRNYVELPIPAPFKKLSAQTGLAVLRLAVKNSDSRRALVVCSALRSLAQETGDAEIAIRAEEILAKGVS